MDTGLYGGTRRNGSEFHFGFRKRKEGNLHPQSASACHWLQHVRLKAPIASLSSQRSFGNRNHFFCPSFFRQQSWLDPLRLALEQLLLANKPNRFFSEAEAAGARLHHLRGEIQDAHCSVFWVCAARMDVRDQISVCIRVILSRTVSHVG
jgi:hypothetical protein